MAFFSDLLKKWFYTNSSSAASSDARVPLLNANGTPKGSDTMANIASILGVGVIRVISIDSTTDIDNLATGIYNGIGWVTDGHTMAAYLICFSIGSYRFQISLSYASGENIIKHRCYNLAYGWSNWKTVND